MYIYICIYIYIYIYMVSHLGEDIAGVAEALGLQLDHQLQVCVRHTHFSQIARLHNHDFS